jgi:hypothetical protein
MVKKPSHREAPAAPFGCRKGLGIRLKRVGEYAQALSQELEDSRV